MDSPLLGWGQVIQDTSADPFRPSQHLMQTTCGRALQPWARTKRASRAQPRAPLAGGEGLAEGDADSNRDLVRAAVAGGAVGRGVAGSPSVGESRRRRPERRRWGSRCASTRDEREKRKLNGPDYFSTCMFYDAYK
jgi:hypothetical protein